MNSIVAAVGSLAPDEVRFVLGVVRHLRHENRYWTLEGTGQGFELRCPAAAGHSAATGGPPGPPSRELLIECGRVVLDLRVAVRALGVHPTVHLLPDADESDLIAVVEPQGAGVPAPDDLALMEAIPLVHGRSQHPVTHRGVHAATITRLRQSAKMEQAWLATLSTDQVQGLWGAELAAPIAPEPHSGVTAVIGSLRDLPTARLQAGQALERVLLTAVACNVQAFVLAVPVSSGEDRRRVRDVIGGGLWPQSVIRLGGPPGDPSAS